MERDGLRKRMVPEEVNRNTKEEERKISLGERKKGS